MVDQAEALRRLALEENEQIAKNNNSRIITVTSGKGGVGKSNFVVNLALSLRKKGKKVLIFDADIGMGNDDVLMGIYPKHNVMDVIKNKVSIKDAIVEGPLGIELLPGGTGLNNIEDLTEEERQRFLTEIELLRGYDYILIDTGAGINRSVLAFVASSDEAIFILTPEPTSLTDGYSLLKALKHFKIETEVKIIVNRAIDMDEGHRTFKKFNSAAERFLKISTDYLGCIMEERKLTMAVRKQVPFVLEYPGSSLSKALEEISQRVMGKEVDSKRSGIKGLFNKIFYIFS